jgi:hypothetical protein
MRLPFADGCDRGLIFKRSEVRGDTTLQVKDHWGSNLIFQGVRTFLPWLEVGLTERPILALARVSILLSPPSIVGRTLTDVIVLGEEVFIIRCVLT